MNVCAAIVITFLVIIIVLLAIPHVTCGAEHTVAKPSDDDDDTKIIIVQQPAEQQHYNPWWRFNYVNYPPYSSYGHDYHGGAHPRGRRGSWSGRRHGGRRRH